MQHSDFSATKLNLTGLSITSVRTWTGTLLLRCFAPAQHRNMALRCCLPPDCHFSQSGPWSWPFSLRNCCFMHTLNLDICSFPLGDLSVCSPKKNLLSVLSICRSHMVCISALLITDTLELSLKQINQIFFLSAFLSFLLPFSPSSLPPHSLPLLSST